MTEAPRVHPLTLRFRDRAWERAFQADYLAKSLAPYRVVLVLLTLAALGPALAGQAVGVAGLVGGPALLAASFAPWFGRVAHAGLALAMVQYAFGRFVLERGHHPPSLAVLQLTLVLVVAFTLSRIGFVLAVPASLAAVAMWVAGGGQDTPRLFGLGAIVYVFSCAAGYMSERHVRREFVASRLLDAEREKSDRLLLNVLPAPVAARLKAGEDPIADAYPGASVVFADLVGSTPLAARSSPVAFVALLNGLFSAFNAAAVRLGIETTRTIGDGYMAVAGVPTPRPDHAEAAAELALAIRNAVAACRTPDGEPLGVRIGINSGPLVAAVVGTTKFSYDAWGDAVNTAARMESHGLPGQIQVTEATHELLKDRYAFERRGVIDVKGKGPMPVYFLLERRTADGVAGAPPREAALP